MASNGSEAEVLRYLIAALSTVGSGGMLYGGFRALRRKRLIENVPTSKVAGVFLGLTEVKGQAEDDRYLRSYLAECDCVWYRYTVDEEWRKTETYTDSKGNRRTRTTSGWTTVKSADVRDPFYLRDETGRIQIVPAKAEIEGHLVFSRSCGTSDPIYYGKGPSGSIANSTFRRRFTEHAIRPKAPIYVIGTARLRDDAVEPEIAHGAEDEMYLVSVKSEEQILKSYGRWSAFMLAFGGFLLNVAPLAFFYDDLAPTWEPILGAAVPFMVGGSLLYALAIFVYYLFLVYNGLISVRNRLRMSWSLIDIQLKRRYDLIPNLVAVVKGYVQHEKSVLEDLAKVRVEGVQRSGGVRGLDVPVGAAPLAAAVFANDQTHALEGLYGIIERYPRIKADKSFLRLNNELSNTETKIALARTFFNESVTALNNRIETMPDALIARFGNFKKAEYFKIEDFEKHPVAVKLDEPAAAEPERRPDEPEPERETARA